LTLETDAGIPPDGYVRASLHGGLDLKPQGSIFEYACHEGNRGLANILSAARAEEPGRVRQRTGG